MDLSQELENMAVNAIDDCDVEFEPSGEEIARWQGLFAYSYPEAVEQIKRHRSDYSRYRVSNDHWDLVRAQKEAQGYSRDAFEHRIKTGGRPAPTHQEPKSIEQVENSGSQAQPSYLILLEGVLNTPKRIQDAAPARTASHHPGHFRDSRRPFLHHRRRDQAIHRKLAATANVHIQTHVRQALESEEGPRARFDPSDTRRGVDSASISRAVESDKLPKAPRRLSRLVFLLRHTYGPRPPRPSLIAAGYGTAGLDTSKHFGRCGQDVARQIQGPC